MLTLASTLARSREPGYRVGCVNNLRQLGISLLVYSSENNTVFPPRSSSSRWPARLKRYYGSLAVLRCPNDGPNPVSFGGPATADAAPRSYIFNGWNDYFYGIPSAYEQFPESAIHYPETTILFGEKVTESGHFWMDIFQGFGNDLTEVEESRHFRTKPLDSHSGGSNYAMADGNVRFFKSGASLAPTNLWAVSDLWRTNIVPFFGR